MTKVIFHPTSVDYAPGTIFDDPQRSNYKYWDKLSEMIEGTDKAYCRHPTANNPTIASVSGTFNRPAPLDFKFDINLDPDVLITDCVVKYKQQKLLPEGNTKYCTIDGAYVEIVGVIGGKRGGPVSSTETTEAISLRGISVTRLNNSDFGIRISYPQNTANVTGRITLSDVSLEVTYERRAYTELYASSSINPITVGQNAKLYFTALKKGEGEYEPTYIIDLPAGIHFVDLDPSSLTEAENFEYTNNTITWTPTRFGYSAENVKKTLAIIVRPTAYMSSANVDFYEPLTSTKARLKLTIRRVTTSIQTTLFPNNVPYRAGTEFSHNILLRSNEPQTPKLREVDIILTGNPTVLNADIIRGMDHVVSLDVTDFDRQNNRKVLYLKYSDTGTNFTIPLKLRYDGSGEYSETISVYDSADTQLGTLTKQFLVRPEEFETLSYSYYKVPQYYLNVMADDVVYLAGTNAKVTILNSQYNIADYKQNLRLGIYNGDPSWITEDEETFLENVKWSYNMAGTTQTIQTVEFRYDANYPVYFVYSHQYLEDPTVNYVVYNFSDPYLVEKGIYEDKLGEGVRPTFFTPSKNLLDNDDYASAWLNADKETAQSIVDQWVDGGVLNNNVAVRGVRVMFDYITQYTTSFNVELFSNAHLLGNRSVYLEAGNGTATVGSNSDKWGYTITQLTQYIKKLQLRFKARNNTSNDKARVDVSNIRMIVYYIKKSKGCTNFSVDGMRSEDLGIYLQERELNFGTDNKESKYHVTGTDETIINRLNVTSKNIKLKIAVSNCTIKEGIPQIHEIVDMFTNNRELYTNKPILKTLIFDDMPDEEFRFVRIDPFDDEWKGGTYYATITLEIPDGTTYSVAPIRTGGNGYVSTAIAVKPVIYVKSNVDGSCIITESYLNQYMEITDKNIKKGSFIIFDAVERTIRIQNGVEITNSLSFESSWFKIKGYYNFESRTSEILYVEYHSRN